MARPRGTRRAAAAAADPAASDESPSDGPPAPSTLRKRSHADALGHNTTSALPTPAGAETSPRRSKRGKMGKEADVDEADSLRAAPQGAAPHAAAQSRLDPCPSSSTLATSSDLGIENADHPDVDRPLRDDSAAVAAAGDNERTAQERRALKGKAKATDEDQVMAENVASEDAVQKQLRELNELVASQTAILASLYSAVTCNVCLERLERPFALQCGHVFCRSCLINWFFRPRTDGEEEEEEGEGGGDASASSSSNESGDTSAAGHSRAREVRITIANASTSANPAAAAAVRAPSESAEEIAQRRRVEADLWGDVSGPSTFAASAARTTTTSSAAGGRVPPPVSAEEEAELSADALRHARLARFDSRRPAVSPEMAATGTPGVAGPSSSARAPPPPPPPPPASVPIAATTTTTASTSTTSEAAAPAPIPFPIRAPTGEHRIQNLVCPQCRASCAMRAPQRIFALDEVLSTLSRARVNEQGTRPRSASPVKLMRKVDRQKETKGGEDEIDPTLLDEKDKTWGGLFPGEGGTESSRDRRRRLAQVVRDREDGVRRCGHCNWELDERTGICEGCGRQWDISSDDSNSDSSDGGLLPFRRGFLGRQHHDLAHSSGSGSEDSGESDGGSGGSSARGEPIAFGPGRESNEDDNDSYESDFVVKSDYDDEDGGRPGANAASRWKAIRHPSTDDNSSSSSDDSEDGATTRAGRDRRPRQRRRARSETGSSSSSDDSVKWTRRRSPNPDPSSSDDDDDGAAQSRERAKRRRRLQGEVIDPDSDSGSDSASADDDSNSGESSSGSSSEEEEEDVAPRTTRSGRRIAAPAGGRNIDVSGFDTSSGDDDYSAQDSRGSGGSGITDEESSSSSDREAPKGGKARASPTKKKKRAIAASSDDD